LAKVVCENQLPCAIVDNLALTLHLDLVHIVTRACCPPLPIEGKATSAHDDRPLVVPPTLPGFASSAPAYGLVHMDEAGGLLTVNRWLRDNLLVLNGNDCVAHYDQGDANAGEDASLGSNAVAITAALLKTVLDLIRVHVLPSFESFVLSFLFAKLVALTKFLWWSCAGMSLCPI
jgi:hypothetical protein